MEEFYEVCAQRFDAPTVKAIALMGSRARGDAGPFSDIDLVRFLECATHGHPAPDTHLIDKALVVVSDVSPATVEEWFSRPETAVQVIAGLRSARGLIDRDRTFTSIQARAQAFIWDSVMQAKADAWASEQMVGWIEEVHKGLEGLRRDDIGRLLNAQFGCSWGLTQVMCVHRGVLLSGDNALYTEVRDAVGANSQWAHMCSLAFGVSSGSHGAPTLQEQVKAGLRLYVLTAEALWDALRPCDRLLISATVDLVNESLV